MDTILYSSNSVEWLTPKWILDEIIYPLGEVDLDPCSSAAKNVMAKSYFTLADDGLSKNWSGDFVFMNPPYGKTIGDWAGKLGSHLVSGDIKTAVSLVPCRTDTRWFQNMLTEGRGVYTTTICFLKGRVKFTRLNQYLEEVESSSATFPSALICQTSSEEKRSIFRNLVQGKGLLVEV
jgi:hypothetical protein